MLEEQLALKQERLAQEKARKLAQEQRLLRGLQDQYAPCVLLLGGFAATRNPRHHFLVSVQLHLHVSLFVS